MLSDEKVVLCVGSEERSVRELEELVGRKADQGSEKGRRLGLEAVAGHSLLRYAVSAPEGADLDDLLKSLLRMVEETDMSLALPEDCQVYASCFGVLKQSGAFSLEACTLKRLGELGIELDVDLYGDP